MVQKSSELMLEDVVVGEIEVSLILALPTLAHKACVA